jgi:hypothetical protein
MNLLLTLLLAHLFADFPLQNDRIARLKMHSLKGVLLHVLIYAAVTGLLLQQPFRYWPLVLGLGTIHFIIDAVKVVYKTKHVVIYFLVDQALHFISMAVAAYLAYQYWPTAPAGVLPDDLLYIALLCAFVPAFIVLGWVWANELSDEAVQANSLLQWVKHQALAFEQNVGLALIILVFFGQLVIK